MDHPDDRTSPPPAGNGHPSGQTPNQQIRETAIARVMTSTSIGKHPTAFHITGLPILQVALNVDRMSANLASLLAPLGETANESTVNYAKLLAYKQGNRGLIQYQVAVPGYEQPILIFGKLYPTEDRAARVYEIMSSLWSEVFADAKETKGYGIPRPLGVISELSMLTYIPADGDLLNEIILEDRAAHSMRLAGAWLAALHDSKLVLDRRLDINAELTNLQAWAMLIGHKWPDMAESATRLSTLLRERAANLNFTTESPIHKDFHYAHIVVNDGLNVIDFDEVRYGDPNFDVAHFCANLFLLAFRKEDVRYSAPTLQNAFLDTYAQEAAWGIGRRFKYFYGYTCLKIAKQLCTTRGLRPRPDSEEQHTQVRVVLEQGLRVLEAGLM